jgi:hypothetical protein
LAGKLIFMMILITIMNGLMPLKIDMNPLWLAGSCGWLAALLLFFDTTKVLRIQIMVIITAGVVLGIYAMSLGGGVSIDAIISGNTELLTMVAAVGFLRLVALPRSGKTEKLPVGRKAYIQTLLGLSMTSAVINISAPILLADRIHDVRPIQKFTAQSMTRVFCGVACWSPFFAAMAVVLTYTQSASMPWLILAGLPVTLAGLAVVLLAAGVKNPQEVEEFVGYPIHIQSITVPFLLACCVIIGTWLFPQAPILVIISLSALLITCSVLLARVDLKNSAGQMQAYVIDGLPRIVNELTLFLAAGVIAAGMSALIQLDIISSPFSEFDVATASALLGIMLLLSAVGIHPVIQISSLTPMLLSLNPDTNLLAITYLIAWSLGTCSSPLSGTNLVFQGRYNIAAWKIAVWNWPYALIMYVIAVLWLHFLSFAGFVT